MKLDDADKQIKNIDLTEKHWYSYNEGISPFTFEGDVFTNKPITIQTNDDGTTTKINPWRNMATTLQCKHCTMYTHKPEDSDANDVYNIYHSSPTNHFNK